MPKSSILVSSDHKSFPQFSSESFRCSLANFRQACTCAFLSRGTCGHCRISVLHGVLLSVLLIVFLVTMVSAILRSLTRSSSVVLGWFLTVLMIIETQQGEILHEAPDRGRFDTYFVFLPFANNRNNCCHLLTKLLGDGLVAHSSLV